LTPKPILLTFATPYKSYGHLKREGIARTSLRFLANVNSRSCSLYAIARPSVVCRLSVCNARAPYSGGSNFRQYFYGIWYLGHPLTSTKNFMEMS